MYIEASLIDEEAADTIWEAWVGGELTTYEAGWAWWRIADLVAGPRSGPHVVKKLRSRINT